MKHVRRHHRILSIDGGGIYGLVSVLWLRRLCELDEDFLSGDDVALFAGISAGAITAALLPQHERPREALLSGAVEKFFMQQPGIFSNSVDPVQSWLSLWGIGGWLGEEDFRQQLRSVFKDQTLKDLHHPVLISTFDWLGAPKSAPRSSGEGPLNNFNTQLHSSWQPVFFSNHADQVGQDMSVVDVVYGAASPAGLRAIHKGFSDAGLFAVSPSVNSLASIVHLCNTIEYRAKEDLAKHFEQIGLVDDALENATSAEQLWAQRNTLKALTSQLSQRVEKLHQAATPLQRTAMLSVGNGSQTPAFWLQSFNLSMQQLGAIPTNPFQGHLFPPFSSITFGALSGNENLICQEILGPRYHRLQAHLMPIPVIPATVLSRNSFIQQAFEQQIYAAQQSPQSIHAVESARDFLQSPGWLGESPQDTPPSKT